MNEENQSNQELTNLNQEPNFTPPAPGARVGTEDGAKMQPPKKSKKKLLLVLLLLILLVGGAAAAYLYVFKKDASAPEPQAQQTEEPKQTTGPTSFVYAQSRNASPDGPFDLKTFDTTNKQSKTTYDLSKFDSSIIQSAVFNNQIAIVVTGSSEKPSPATVLYSNDAGKNFKAIWTAKNPTSSADPGDQITSLIFSSDGSRLVMGVLPKDTQKNQVTELSLEGTYPTTILTTLDAAGAYLHAYDKNSGQLLYHEGCFNCGGGPIKQVLIYNSKTKAKSVLITSSQNLFPKMYLNKSANKLLYAEASQGENGSQGKTTINEITLSDKKVSNLYTTKSENDPLVIEIGYQNNSSNAYYTTEKSVVGLEGGKQVELFTTSGRIATSFYVSDTEIIVQTGEPEGTFTVSSFALEDKKNTQLFTGAATTYRLLGVTANNQ